MHRLPLTSLITAVCLALPASASAQDTLVVPDPAAEQIAALDEYSFSQTVGGNDMRSFLAAASEGDSDENVRGLAIQSAATHWTLTDATHAGDPNVAIIHRQTGACLQHERLVSAPGATHEFAAIDLAADGATLYLVKPGTGIVAHAFSADPSVTC